MKPKRYILICTIMILGFSVLFTGIYIGGFKSSGTQAKNRKAIEAVVRQVFTCPNEELIALYSDMNERLRTTIRKYTDNRQAAVPADNSGFFAPDGGELDSKLKELYSPYFTDKGYEEFIKRFFIIYNVYSTALDYKIAVDKVDITQSETIPTNYSFKVTLSYGPEESSLNDMVIEGSAQLYEKVGKISYIQFLDSKLFRELWDKGPSL